MTTHAMDLMRTGRSARRRWIAAAAVALFLAALLLAGGPGGFLGPREAEARASVGTIVVNRDNQVSGRRTATLTALCLRGYVMFTWGFRATNANPDPRQRINALFLGARPVVTGTGSVGVIAQFFNPNATTTAVRLSVTCVRPIDMNLRFRSGNRAVTVRGRASSAGAAATKPELGIAVATKKATVAPGGFATIRQFCSSGRPVRVPVSSSFVVGLARLGANFPIRSGKRFGWQAEFGNPTSTPQTVESTILCAEGRGMSVRLSGAGLGQKPAARAAGAFVGLLIRGDKFFQRPVFGQFTGFGGTCKPTSRTGGIFQEIAFDANNVVSPARLPYLVEWNHPDASRSQQPRSLMSRSMSLDFPAFDPNVVPAQEVRYQPICGMGARGQFKIGPNELILFMD